MCSNNYLKIQINILICIAIVKWEFSMNYIYWTADIADEAHKFPISVLYIPSWILHNIMVSLTSKYISHRLNWTLFFSLGYNISTLSRRINLFYNYVIALHIEIDTQFMNQHFLLIENDQSNEFKLWIGSLTKNRQINFCSFFKQQQKSCRQNTKKGTTIWINYNSAVFFLVK